MSLLTDQVSMSFCFCQGDHCGAGWSGDAGDGAGAPVEAGRGARSLASRGLLDHKWLDKGCDFVSLAGLFQVAAREVVLDMCCSAHWELKEAVVVDADAGVDVDGVMEDGGVEDADVLEHVDEDDVKDVEDVVLHVLDGIESAVAYRVVDAVASDVRLELPVDLGVHTALDLVVHTNLQVVFQVCHRRQLAQSVDPHGRPVSQDRMGMAHVDVAWEQRSCLVRGQGDDPSIDYSYPNVPSVASRLPPSLQWMERLVVVQYHPRHANCCTSTLFIPLREPLGQLQS